MQPTVEIHPKGGPELEAYINDLRNLKEELKLAGIAFEVFRTRLIEPISTLIVTILGSVSSYFIIKCIDTLLERRKKDTNKDINIISMYEGKGFQLPDQHAELSKHLHEGTKSNGSNLRS